MSKLYVQNVFFPQKLGKNLPGLQWKTKEKLVMALYPSEYNFHANYSHVDLYVIECIELETFAKNHSIWTVSQL